MKAPDVRSAPKQAVLIAAMEHCLRNHKSFKTIILMSVIPFNSGFINLILSLKTSVYCDFRRTNTNLQKRSNRPIWYVLLNGDVWRRGLRTGGRRGGRRQDACCEPKRAEVAHRRSRGPPAAMTS